MTSTCKFCGGELGCFSYIKRINNIDYETCTKCFNAINCEINEVSQMVLDRWLDKVKCQSNHSEIPNSSNIPKPISGTK